MDDSMSVGILSNPPVVYVVYFYTLIEENFYF